MIVPVPWQQLRFPCGRADGPSGIWSTPAPHHLQRLASLQPAPRPISAVVSSDAQVADAVTPHHPHPVGAWPAPADNITGGPMPGHRTGGSRTTPPSGQAADVGQGMRSRCSGASAMRDPPVARRACGEATSPARPAAPQVTLHTGEPQAGQAGLPLGRPALPLPRGRLVGPAGRPLAGQSLLVEPVTHRRGVHAKLAGDAGGWPSPRYRPVGKVCPQGGEAEFRRPGGELLVGGGAPRVGGGHPAG